MTSAKSVKMAALVVGTLAAAGSAAPAFAADDLTPTSLNGGLYTAIDQTQGAVDTVSSDALDSNKADSLGPTVDAVTEQVTPVVQQGLPTGHLLREGTTTEAASHLLGDLPDALTGATGQGLAPMLGGLPLGG